MVPLPDEAFARRCAVALATAVAVLANLPASAAEPSPEMRDAVSVIAADMMVDAAASYCDAQAPAEGQQLRAAQQDWRQRHGVAEVRSRLKALQSTLDAQSADVTRKMQERLAASGKPAESCNGMRASLATPAMNLRERYPGAYSPSVAADATAPARKASPSPSDVAAGRPTGTYVTPAQVAALLDKTRGIRDRDERLKAAGLYGRIYVKGQVVQRGDSFFLDTIDGAFHSRMLVSPGVDLKPHLGREVTVGGKLDEVPLSVAFLRESRIVADPSALLASTAPKEAGLSRMSVDVSRISKPGHGLADKDIEGVLYHGEGRTGVSGYEYVESALLLLRDGTAYAGDEVAPSDLDVKASRELEPQRWMDWRRSGGSYQVRRHDDHGKVDGDWSNRSGTLQKGWPSAHRLAGSYSTSSFVGSAALGGTFFRNGVSFTSDGRYEGTSFTQSGSGTMAATLNGFSAGATSYSDKTGTQSSAFGGNADVVATAKSAKDDGADRRGTYRFDGYTLEIRYDSGRVARLLSFPLWGDGSKAVWVGGRSYAVPSKK